jgi:hypothetical protein
MTRLNYKKTAILQFALAALTMLGVSRQASAQAAEPAATTTAAPAAPAVEEAPASRYPRGVIDRPLTLPAGLTMLGSDFIANHDFSFIGAAPIIGYGVTDDFEIQVPYQFALKEFEAKGLLSLELGYKILRGAADGKLELIGRVRPAYDFLAEAAYIQAGLHVQYNATPKFAIISGIPGTEQLKITVATKDDAPKPVTFAIPLGLGFQATPELYFELDTTIANINISDSATTVIGSDVTPVALTAVYNAMPALDIQAQIFTDLSNEPDQTLGFLVGFRYYAGKL